MEERNPILACELAVKTWSNIRKEELKDCQFRAVRDYYTGRMGMTYSPEDL